MNSLERSLQAGLLVSLVVLMLVFLWSGSLISRLLSESFVYRELERESGVIVAALDLPPVALARPRLSERVRLDPAYEAVLSGKYFAVRLERDGRIVSRSAWDQALDVPLLAPGQRVRRRATGASGEPLLLSLGGFAENGYAFTVAVARDISAIEARLAVFRWYFAAMSLLLLVALLVVQHLIVRRSVNKLDAIRGELERLEHGQAAALSEDVPSEIVPLVREFNRLLLRFDQRTRQSRNAVGNLAHALKGPLGLLLRSAGAPLEAAADRSGANVPRQAIAQNAERIRQLIESELRRARLAGRGKAGQRFDLEAELPSLAGLLEQVYPDKRVDIRWHVAADAELMQDRQDMLELVGNLLDNAAKWASAVVMLNVRRTTEASARDGARGVAGDAACGGGETGPLPRDGVRARPRGDRDVVAGIRLDVEDDGPGCEPGELLRLTERGVRLDESVAGHGLGLSIVKDIVDTYGGRLELGRSVRLGGLRATVYLPNAN